MKDKYKLWITAALLVVVLTLLISTMLKITPKKISNLLTPQNSQQTQLSNISLEETIQDVTTTLDESIPKEIVQDENTHSDESKSDLKEETEKEEEQLKANEGISVGGSW